MENILKNIVIVFIVILVAVILFFFWKLTPKKEANVNINLSTKEDKEVAMPKQLQFKTGFETYKKSDKKESSGSAVKSIDYFKIDK